MGSAISLSPVDLYARIGTASAPFLFDVRRAGSFDADDTLIVGALRRDPESVAAWQREVPRNRSVVLYCARGQEVSQQMAAALRACSFDAFLKIYEIKDQALDALALIVRGADTARLELAPQSPGLLALSLGLSANFQNDHEMLEHGMAMYDAFYAWCRSCQEERHNWTPEVRA